MNYEEVESLDIDLLNLSIDYKISLRDLKKHLNNFIKFKEDRG